MMVYSIGRRFHSVNFQYKNVMTFEHLIILLAIISLINLPCEYIFELSKFQYRLVSACEIICFKINMSVLFRRINFALFLRLDVYFQIILFMLKLDSILKLSHNSF